VLHDRRLHPRRTVNRRAKFQGDLGALPRDCTVTDISARGARLYSETATPDRFTLAMDDDGREIRRDCRVVWRLGGELGVEFVDARRA
jgi:hypothetical protein